MEIQGILWLQLVLGLLPRAETAGELGFNIDEFRESPGLFYVDRGSANLYKTTWKTIKYFNLEEENIEIDTLRTYMSC